MQPALLSGTPPIANPVNGDVGISIKARLVIVNQFSALRFSQLPVFDPLRDLSPETVMQQTAFITSAARRLAHRSAAYHFLDQVAFLIDVDVRLVRRAEEVMTVPHDLLVCTDQHESKIIRLADNQFVQFQHLLHIVQINKFIHDPV